MNLFEQLLHLFNWIRWAQVRVRIRDTNGGGRVGFRRSLAPGPPSWWEIARRVHPEPTLKGTGDRLVFWWRSLWAWPYASAWYAWLHESVLGRVAVTRPGLYKKIVRPYMTPVWDCRRRLRALREHYEFVFGRLRPEMWARVFAPPGLLLLECTADAGRRYRVFLGYESRCNKEGETTLLLFSERDGICLCSLTALVMPLSGGGHGLLIGAIQGMPAGVDKNIVKEVAKSWHGLRPKALLLFLAQELAAAWGLRRVLAISNDLHVSRHAVYFFNRSRRPRLGYDDFWVESGGWRRADGLFVLPLRHEPRDLDALKPGKRQLYRRRHALLDDLRCDFAVALARVTLERPDSAPGRSAAVDDRPPIVLGRRCEADPPR